jgi:peroxiredoxin
LDGFNEILNDLKANNISVVAASSDPRDKAAEMAKDLKFPVGYGVDKDTSDSLGGYWEPRRNFAQPSEFLITPSGKMAQVSYSDGPLARTEAGDVIKLVSFLESLKKK